MTNLDQLLEGVKVVDLTWHIAGPYCTKLLADCGAEIIKIEKPGEGDPARRMGPFPDNLPHPEKSALYLYLNTGKKSITLNLKSEFGKKIIKELVKSADILVESFSPRVMPSLGLDYETLEAINPKLVMVSISNFGQTGPYRDFKADENVLHAMGGLTWESGDNHLPPVRQGGSQSQYLTGLHAFAATMIAFHCQQVAGIGQHVDQSIMEAWAYHTPYPGWLYTGRIRERVGGIQNLLFGLHPAKDGYCGICVARDWEPFKQVLEMPELDDSKFASTQSRDENGDELTALVLSWTMDHPKKEIYYLLQEAGIAAGMAVTIGDLFEDKQLKSRDFFAEIDHPVAGKFAYPTLGAKLSETPCQLRRAPLLGEHNEEVYCGHLGFDKADLARLRQEGLI